MSIYVYSIATGALVSWCPNDADPVADSATLKANGLASVRGLSPLDSSHAWNAVTATVISVTPPTPTNLIDAHLFVMCFTGTEVAAIKASVDPQVVRFMLMLSVAQQVDLNSTIVQGGVAYLTSIGLIASARVAQILAGQEQSS